MIKPNLLITVYCTPCNRKVVLEDADIPEDGRPIGYRMRCKQCGGRGQVIASPRDHNPSNQMMGPDFYGFTPGEPRPEPIKKRRRRKR